MKKILLLAALSCFMIVQTKNVFGKCSPICSFIRLSDFHSGVFSYPDTDIVPIFYGDTVSITYYPGLICIAGACLLQTLFYQDGILIRQDTLQSYYDSMHTFITVPGLYKLDVSCGHICIFRIISSLTAINNISFSTLPFPFSKLSSSTYINNLQYKIITPLGQVIEEGKFSGEIILRGNNISHSLQPGIYFVIYSDALDNRQVITDKVFVNNY